MRVQAKQEWDLLSAEDREPWNLMFRAAAQRRQQAQIVPVAPEAEPPKKFEPLWPVDDSSRDVAHMVPLCRIVEYYKKNDGPTRSKLACEDLALVVQAPVADRECQEECNRKLFGCFGEKKNVCMAVLDPELRKATEANAKLLSKFADKLGKDVVSSAATLVWIQQDGLPEGVVGSNDSIVLLVSARWRPKVQYFVRCLLSESEAFSLRVPPPPFQVRIGTSESSLSTNFRGVTVCTSSELALAMARSAGASWQLRPLQWSEVPRSSLLRLQVDGAEPPFEHVLVRPPARVARPSEFLDDVFDNDPLQHGLYGGGLPRSRSAASGFQAGGGNEANVPREDHMSDEEQQADAEAWAQDSEAEDDEDILENLQEGLVVLVEVAPDEAEDPLQRDEAEESLEGLQAVAEAVAEVAEDAAAEAAAPEAASALPAWQQATIDAEGYVSCPVEPFNAWNPKVGRLTDWPKTQPAAKRSVSMRCCRHTACTTPARRRHAVSDSFLMKWLFEGPDGVGATIGEKKAQGLQHVAMFAVLERQAREAAVPPAV